MMELFDAALAFPTAIYSILLSIVIIYWCFVLFGALDIDIIDVGGVEGAGEGVAEGAAEGIAEGVAEGVAEGAAEGIAEGVAEGAAEGIAEGVAEGAAEGMAEGASEGMFEGATDAVGDGIGEGAAEGAAASVGGLAGFLSALKLRSAPVTVMFSFLVLWAWVFSFTGMKVFGALFAGTIPTWAYGTITFFLAFFLSLFATSVSIRPLGKFFVSHTAKGREQVLGKLCTITTGRVDDEFGQAEFNDEGASLLLSVRCDQLNDLKKGDQVLVFDYDIEREAFIVEPLSAILGDPADEVPAEETVDEPVEVSARR